jgi:hypothetical protein
MMLLRGLMRLLLLLLLRERVCAAAAAGRRRRDRGAVNVGRRKLRQRAAPAG